MLPMFDGSRSSPIDDSVEAVKLDPKSAAENPETGQTSCRTGEKLPAPLASDIILVVFNTCIYVYTMITYCVYNMYIYIYTYADYHDSKHNDDYIGHDDNSTNNNNNSNNNN